MELFFTGKNIKHSKSKMIEIILSLIRQSSSLLYYFTIGYLIELKLILLFDPNFESSNIEVLIILCNLIHKKAYFIL